MIRTYLEFELAPGKADGFVDFFERAEILPTAAAQDGCLGTELTLSADGATAVVTALWADEAAYDTWTSRGDRGDLAVELNTYLREGAGPTTVGRVFRVRLRAG